MTTKNATIALLLLGLGTSFAEGQIDLRRQTLSTWTIEQGLPQNFVTALDQTPDGFLWVGTMGGLARFDGLNFRTVFAGDPPALHSGVNSIGHDAAGHLWVGTSSGLLREHDGTFHAVDLPDPGPPHVERAVVSRYGGVWVDTGQHLWKLEADEKTVHKIETDAPRLRSFAEDVAGTLWFTDEHTVTALHRDGHRDRFSLASAGVVSVGKDGVVYVGDGHHLFRFERDHFEPVPGTELDEFVSLTVARDGAVWLASGGLQGIARKDDRGVQRLGVAEGLASNDARVLLEDRRGGMWVGTIAGLQRLHEGTFTPFTVRDGLPSALAQYDAIFAMPDGDIWAGTLQDGVAVFRDGHWTSYGADKGVRHGQIRGFADDGSLMPLIAIADYGLFRWNGKSYAPIPGIPTGYVTTPIRARDGSIWFSEVHNGVFHLQGTHLTHYAAAEGLTDPTIWSLLEDGKGGLFGGGRSGLFHFDGTRWSRVYPDIHSIVAALLISSRGELVAGTNAGLFILRNGKVRTISRAQGLPADNVIEIQEDPDGSLWLANPVGVYRVTRAQIDGFLDGSLKTISPEIYTERDGLPSRDLLPMSDTLAARGGDGRLWLATTRGPSVGVWRPASAPQAFVDTVSDDGVMQPSGATRIPPGRHRITFTFTAPNFTAPEQLHFRYKLVGWDAAWVDAANVREASYAALPPGSYHLQVQAIGRGGIEGPIASGATVELRPFFWQTRTFVLTSLAAVLLLAIEFTRRRTLLRARRAARRIEERAAERERIAYQIHDTVIQDLIGATLYLEIAEMEVVAGSADPQKQLKGLAARLRETVGRSRNMVASLHSTSRPQHGLLEVLRLAEAEFRMNDKPAFSIESTGIQRSLGSMLHDEVALICREAVANAFRHSGANIVQVRVEFEPHALFVEVMDDGVGMDAVMQANGRAGHFGLTSMRARSESIGAHLEMQSAPGAGTVVRLRLRASWSQRLMSRLRMPPQSKHFRTQEAETQGESS